jgi:hypothetical protein
MLLMDTRPGEQNEFSRRIIRRILASNALQRMRRMVNEIEREEATDKTDKKLLRILLIVLPFILVLAAIFVYSI